MTRDEIAEVVRGARVWTPDNGASLEWELPESIGEAISETCRIALEAEPESRPWPMEIFDAESAAIRAALATDTPTPEQADCLTRHGLR